MGRCLLGLVRRDGKEASFLLQTERVGHAVAFRSVIRCGRLPGMASALWRLGCGEGSSPRQTGRPGRSSRPTRHAIYCGWRGTVHILLQLGEGVSSDLLMA